MKMMQVNLDDRHYDQLLSEAMKLVVKEYSDLTDFSPSDLGMTLTELFAFLMEATIYQMNCVPDRTYRNFARFLAIPSDASQRVEVVKNLILSHLGEKKRAVSIIDIEMIALDRILDYFKKKGTAVNQNDVRVKASFDEEENEINLVVGVYADQGQGKIDELETDQELFGFLMNELERVSPLGTNITALAPVENDFSISIHVASDSNTYVDKNNLKDRITNAIVEYFDPLRGYDGKGWPYGRLVFTAEFYPVIESINGVGHIIELELQNNGSGSQDENSVHTSGKMETAQGTNIADSECSAAFVPRVTKEGVNVVVDGS